LEHNSSFLEIDKNGLQFGVGAKVTVLMINNLLTAKVFKGLKEINPNITQLRLHFEHNKIDDLPKEIFKKY
jgi:hypothetical protein